MFDGSCESCYSGFILNNGVCTKGQAGEQGCARYDLFGNCLECPSRTYLMNNRCVPVDNQCAQFDYNQKVCVGCYSGYSLLKNVCQITKVEVGKEIANCFAYNPEGSCLQCLDRYFVQNNTCQEVNVFCKAFSLTNGSCTDCYTGFRLVSGTCQRN